MSTPAQRETRTYVPKQISLGQDNYLQWQILMRRNIERLGWLNHIHIKGVVRTKEEEKQLQPDELKTYKEDWKERL